MNFHPFHSPVMQHWANALHTATLSAGSATRFVLLSTIACLLLSRPLSLSELSHASHSPAPRA